MRARKVFRFLREVLCAPIWFVMIASAMLFTVMYLLRLLIVEGPGRVHEEWETFIRESIGR